MLWSKLYIACFCMLIMAGLSGCGFAPIYADKDMPAVARPDIDISNIPDREGQYLRNLLIDRLYTSGRPTAAPYELRFTTLQKDIVNIGIQKDATATRAQMQITTQMQLVEKSTSKVLLQRTLKTADSYNLLDNQLATLVSQQNVTDSILREMGDDVITELNLYFRRTSILTQAAVVQ
ncbi:MAG: hypothetical protein HY052_08880 [Proteobacteria bacterium]|nr:hypothetical protein [Pseudomonadota bacterium]